MQEENIENLDKCLQNILITKNMSLYKNNYDYFLFDNAKINTTSEFISEKHKRIKFIKVENFFTDIQLNNYTSINIDKEAKNIFHELYISSNQLERTYMIDHYYYFIAFDQMFNYLIKNENDRKALSFVTHSTLKGKIREVDKEEKLLKKIYTLEPDNFYENLLAYLTNHSRIYTQSIERNNYQGMLKNLIFEYLPEKRKSFAMFTGDSQKKFLNHTSILYENEKDKCEILVAFNRTVIEESFIPDKLKEKHLVASEQSKMINNLDNLIRFSKRLNIKEVVTVFTQDKEIIRFYITKDKNDISKEDVVKYVQSCLNYWKNNIVDLKDKNVEEMLQIIEQKAEIENQYENFEKKYEIKNISEKKVKI